MADGVMSNLAERLAKVLPHTDVDGHTAYEVGDCLREDILTALTQPTPDNWTDEAWERDNAAAVDKPVVTDEMVEAVADAISNADSDGPDPEEYWQHLAKAALAAQGEA